jgi:hypothetical protein
VHWAGGQHNEALVVHKECAGIYRTLIELQPNHPQHQHDLADLLHKVGHGYGSLARLDDAVAAYKEALEIHRDLAERKPAHFQRMHDLAQSLNLVGGVQAERGYPDEAIVAFRECLTIRRGLAELHPDRPRCRHDLAWSLVGIGDAEEKRGGRAQATEHYRAALELIADLHHPASHRRAILRLAHDGLARCASAPMPPGSAVAIPKRSTQPPPEHSGSKPDTITSTVRDVCRLLAEHKPDQALESLARRPNDALELRNAEAVCHLRAGNAAPAQRVLANIALCGATRRLRRDVPPEVLVNYVTATLLAEGDVDYCESLLEETADCEAGRRLKRAIQAWRTNLPWQHRIRRFIVGGRVKDFELPYEPGALVGTSGDEEAPTSPEERRR